MAHHRMKHPSGCFFHSVVARRYASSIAHKLLALSSTNSAFVLSFPFKLTPSAMEFAYAPCAYLANSEHYAEISTNTCLLLNAKTRMANSPTLPPFTVASPLSPQILLRVCRSGYHSHLIYSVLQNLFVYLRAGNIPPLAVCT